MIYDKISKEKQRVETQIETLQTKLKDFPEGKLICSNTGKYSKWYRSYGSTSTYIPKKERWLAEKLAHKKLLSLQLNTLLEEKKALDFYLRHIQNMPWKLNKPSYVPLHIENCYHHIYRQNPKNFKLG